MFVFEFTWQGEVIRVVGAEDVLALPYQNWSMGGFGDSITEEWLLHEGKLPGSKVRRRILAQCLVRALDAHYRKGTTQGDGEEEARGPFVRCDTCKGKGFVARPAEQT